MAALAGEAGGGDWGGGRRDWTVVVVALATANVAGAVGVGKGGSDRPPGRGGWAPAVVRGRCWLGGGGAVDHRR